MKLKIFVLIILGISALYGNAQYQIPLYVPGNTGGFVSGNEQEVLAVAGQNAIGMAEANSTRVYLGILSPLAFKYTATPLVNMHNSKLGQNFPNPYRKFTTIPFELVESAKVKLLVTDISGRPVKILLNQEMPPGVHYIHFNADRLTPGIFMYQMEIEDHWLVKTMVLTK